MWLGNTQGPGAYHSLCPVPQVRLWARLFLHGRTLSGHACARQLAGPAHWLRRRFDLLDLCHIFQHLPKAEAVSSCQTAEGPPSPGLSFLRSVYPGVNFHQTCLNGLPKPKPQAPCGALPFHTCTVLLSFYKSLVTPLYMFCSLDLLPLNHKV